MKCQHAKVGEILWAVRGRTAHNYGSDPWPITVMICLVFNGEGSAHGKRNSRCRWLICEVLGSRHYSDVAFEDKTESAYAHVGEHFF